MADSERVKQAMYCIRAQLDLIIIDDYPTMTMADADAIADKVARALEREGHLS